MTVDFDIVDDDVIQSAEIIDGFIHIGRAKYKNIIIPEGAYIPESTQKSLNKFIGCGGKILYELSALKPVVEVDGVGLRAMHRKAENAEIFILFNAGICIGFGGMWRQFTKPRNVKGCEFCICPTWC